jgi:hypothetical protein
MTKHKEVNGNICGIIGVSIGWLIPIIGIIAGIISLNKKEDDRTVGISAIVVSSIALILWILILIGGVTL